MEWELDYSTYHVSTKYMMDFDDGKESWSKPKLNKGNNLFVKNIDKITYNGVELNILDNSNNDRKDTDNVEQQNSEPIQQQHDNGLHIYDSSDIIKKES